MKLTSISSRTAFTVMEVLVAAAVTSLILAGVALGTVALQKSFNANRNYIRDSANSSRLIDYISQDLRNAVKVSQISGGVATTLKTGTVVIDGTTQLSIFVPDYYRSNIPDNTGSSDFKTGRYSRAYLPAGRTSFEYDVVTDIDSFPRTLKFVGNVEVRYVKKARSASDSTPCYFRQEYDGGATPVLRREQEIAEYTAGEKLTVLAIDPKSFQVGTSFNSKWTGEAQRDGTRQFATVCLVNHRTDLL